MVSVYNCRLTGTLEHWLLHLLLHYILYNNYINLNRVIVDKDVIRENCFASFVGTYLYISMYNFSL